jgi:hypothetical protein
MLSGLKYLLLTPFSPLKMFREIEEQEKQSSIAWTMYWAGLLFFIVLGSIILNLNGDLSEIIWLQGFIYFIVNIFDAFVFVLLFAITVAILKSEMGQMHIVFLILGSTLLPQFISYIAAMYMDYDHFYLNWLTTFWRMGIASMGIWVINEGNIIKAIIIAFVCFLGVHFVDYLMH